MRAPTVPVRWPVVIILWLAIAVIMTLQSRNFIEVMNFRDADDALRLVQVRDWMAGQGWSDLVQHRIDPLHSQPMHWSRLVDLPIAAAIWIAGLFVGPADAERVAMVAVPLLLLLGLFIVVARMAAKVAGDTVVASIAAAMLGMSIGIDIQFQPLRIDHHGWQILLDAIACLLILDPDKRWHGRALGAGLAMALSLIVALEGMPVAVGLAGLLAFRYLRDPAWFPALVGYLAALTGGGAILLLATLGTQAGAVPWCDTLSPAYLVPMLAAAVVLPVAGRLIGHGSLIARVAPLALAGGVTAILFFALSGQCARGPFSTLDPLVYDLWYTSVGEGMPVWTQSADVATLVPVQGFVGIVGAILALRAAAPDRRRIWAELLALQVLTFALSLLVIRTMGIAHVLALPGAAWLFYAAIRAATSRTSPLLRVVLGLASFAVTPVGLQMAVLAVTDDSPAPVKTPANGSAANRSAVADADAVPRFTCSTYKGTRGLDALAPALLFTPMDIGAHLLAYTRHSVVATGHHRNVASMKTVIEGFTFAPDRARAVILASGARYVAWCSGENEVRKYMNRSPHGLMATLEKGPVPDWLEPVPMRKGELIHVYRVVR